MQSETMRKRLCVWCRNPLGDDPKVIYAMVDTDNKGCLLHDGCGDGSVPWSEEDYHAIKALMKSRDLIALEQPGWHASVMIINTDIKELAGSAPLMLNKMTKTGIE